MFIKILNLIWQLTIKKQVFETKSLNTLTTKKSFYSKKSKGKGKTGSNKVMKCMFCKNEHKHLDCSKYATSQSRRSILNIDKATGKCADGRCSKCLYFHKSSNCVTKGLCLSNKCTNKQPHARFLCDTIISSAASQNQLAISAATSVQSNCDPQEPITTNCSI